MAFPDFLLVVKYHFVQEIEELTLLLIKNYSLKPWVISFGEGREESRNVIVQLTLCVWVTKKQAEFPNSKVTKLSLRNPLTVG